MARTQKGHAMSGAKLRNKLRNDLTFASYYDMLKHMAENSFTWMGFDPSVDPHFIEEMLYIYGMVAVFYEKDVGIVTLPALQAGGFDIYGKPKMVRAFSQRTGFSRLLKYSPDVDATECILIHNTNRDLNSSIFKSTLAMYSERMAEMKRTEDVNIYAQRTPITMVVPQGQVETYTNLLDRINNFGQVIFGYKGLDIDAIKSIKTDAPWVADNVDTLFIRTWNEAVGYLGISNVGVNKKERVSTDEANLSMGSSMTFRQMRYEPRSWACKLLKEKWGLDVTVDFSEVFRQEELDLREQNVKIAGQAELQAITEEIAPTEEKEGDDQND